VCLLCNDKQIAMKLNLELAWLVALIAVVGQQQSLVMASRVGALNEQLVGLVGALSEELEDEVSSHE
jgi:hypothetical protein